jgi:hypothetical protein
MLQNATSKEQTDWQIYPKNKKGDKNTITQYNLEQNMISLSRDGRQTLNCMLCPNNSSIVFVQAVLNSGGPPAHSNSFF